MTIVFGSPEPAWLDPLFNFGGVLLGAMLAWGTSYYFERKAEKDRNLTIAYSLLFKIQQICDQVIKLEQHVTESIATAEKNGLVGQPWTKIVDIIGFEDPYEPISPDELALVAKTKDSALIMQIRELESGHFIIFQTYKTISEMRKQLGQAGLATKTEGQIVSFEVTPEQYAQVAPLIISLDTSSSELTKMLPRLAREAQQVANRIGNDLKKHYRFGHFISLSLPEKEH